MQSKSSKNVNEIIEKLVERYPNGISARHCFWRSPPRPLVGISPEEIKLLATTARNAEDFRKLLDSNPKAAAALSTYVDKLISNYCNKIVATRKYDITIENRKQRNKIKSQERQARAAADRAEAAKRRQKAAIQAKKKATKRANILKQLNLSAEQKQLLKQLAGQ